MGVVASEGQCCEIAGKNACKCVSAECQCDEAKGACFCVAPQAPSAADMATGAAAAPVAEPVAAGAAVTADVAPSAVAVAGAAASSELKIRQDEHACKDAAHKLADESATLLAIKACEEKTLAQSKAAGIVVQTDNSVSAIAVTKAPTTTR